MAQKGQEKGVTGPAPVVDEPGRVRNVVLVGHSGAGKTTLVEALLAATGTIPRAGIGDRGHHGLRPRPGRRKPAAFGQPGLRAADAPGHQGQPAGHAPGTPTSSVSCGPACGPRTRRCSWSPAVDGMDAATAALWEECAAVGMPRAVAVTRLDHQRADFDETVTAMPRDVR